MTQLLETFALLMVVVVHQKRLLDDQEKLIQKQDELIATFRKYEKAADENKVRADELIALQRKAIEVLSQELRKAKCAGN